jgi:hypothetical protein
MDHSYLVSDDKQELKLAMPTSLLGLPQDVLNLILTDLASHTIFLVRRCCRAIRRAVRLFLSSRLVRPLVLGEELPSRREVVAFLSTAKEHDLSRFVSFHTRSRDTPPLCSREPPRAPTVSTLETPPPGDDDTKEECLISRHELSGPNGKVLETARTPLLAIKLAENLESGRCEHRGLDPWTLFTVLRRRRLVSRYHRDIHGTDDYGLDIVRAHVRKTFANLLDSLLLPGVPATIYDTVKTVVEVQVLLQPIYTDDPEDPDSPVCYYGRLEYLRLLVDHWIGCHTERANPLVVEVAVVPETMYRTVAWYVHRLLHFYHLDLQRKLTILQGRERAIVSVPEVVEDYISWRLRTSRPVSVTTLSGNTVRTTSADGRGVTKSLYQLFSKLGTIHRSVPVAYLSVPDLHFGYLERLRYAGDVEARARLYSPRLALEALGVWRGSEDARGWKSQGVALSFLDRELGPTIGPLLSSRFRWDYRKVPTVADLAPVDAEPLRSYVEAVCALRLRVYCWLECGTDEDRKACAKALPLDIPLLQKVVLKALADLLTLTSSWCLP